MAHKWNPKTDPVGKDEPIGRRLFDEPMLMGAQDQLSFKGLDYRHFEVTPGDRELSLDRLGATGIEKKAKNHLKPRADAAGANRVPAKQFNGWAHVRASALEKGWSGQCFPVVASPIDLDGLEGNTHHAHIVIEGDVTFSAFRLRELFTSRGTVEKIEPPKAPEGTVETTKAPETASVWRMLLNLFKAKNRQ